jgi:hypothetical protein
MPFRPDIVITRPDSSEVLLVVEVKRRIADVTNTEAQLKRYMVQISCPVGMLVTDRDTRFYRNSYTGYDEQSVHIIGSCPTGELFGELSGPASLTESELEWHTYDWLESLRGRSSAHWPVSVGEAIESSVLPSVMSGTLGAGGPRWRRTGS